MLRHLRRFTLFHYTPDRHSNRQTSFPRPPTQMSPRRPSWLSTCRVLGLLWEPRHQLPRKYLRHRWGLDSMKLVATESGRVVQLVVLDEVRPERGFDLPAFFHKVAMRYGFAKTPTDLGGSINQPVPNLSMADFRIPISPAKLLSSTFLFSTMESSQRVLTLT